jgi:tetratricopeptide (TPR) repeat protein
MQVGAPERALVHYQKALEVCRRWVETDHSINARSTLRGAYSGLAGALKESGNLYGARGNYETALKTVEEALRHPDATVYERSTLANAHQSLANILGNPDELNLGDRSGALSHASTAIETFEAIAASDRHDVRARGDLAGGYYSLAAILLEAAPAEALRSYQQAATISKELSTDEPSNTSFRRDLAMAEMGIGEALHRLGKNREALQKLTPALELIKSVVAASPDRPSLIEVVARLHRDIGNTLLALRDDQGALENYREALAVIEDLLRQAPSSLYSQRQRADVYESFGQYYLSAANRAGSSPAKRGKFNVEARLWFQKSLALWQDWMSRNVATPYAASRQRQAAAYLASCDQL